jgi:hypothetical protein
MITVDAPASLLPSPARGQFLRVDKFAIAAPKGKEGGNNLDKVANEALRVEGFCPHVEDPKPPVLRFGVDPIEAARLAKDWASKQSTSYLHKPSQTQMYRKRRDDRPAALVGVASVPPEWVVGRQWDDFTSACILWLKVTFGEDRLTSVLEHQDERCLHLHFWVIPRPGESFSSIHDGERAIDAVGRSASKVLRDVAYKKAMAKLLDDFQDKVAGRFGLVRETVRGHRKTRKQWLHDQWLEEQRENAILERIEAAEAKAIKPYQARLLMFESAAETAKAFLRERETAATAAVSTNLPATQNEASLQVPYVPFNRFEFDVKPLIASQMIDIDHSVTSESTVDEEQQWIPLRER